MLQNQETRHKKIQLQWSKTRTLSCRAPLGINFVQPTLSELIRGVTEFREHVVRYNMAHFTQSLFKIRDRLFGTYMVSRLFGTSAKR